MQQTLGGVCGFLLSRMVRLRVVHADAGKALFRSEIGTIVVPEGGVVALALKKKAEGAEAAFGSAVTIQLLDADDDDEVLDTRRAVLRVELDRRLGLQHAAVTVLQVLQGNMDTTIRNLDEQAYREARARAVLEGRTVGDVVNEALRSYLKRAVPKGKRSLAELRPEPFPEDNEGLSGEIDEVVYGSRA